MTTKHKLERVMIIDDETFDRKMYRRILERSGVVGEVIGFSYAADALGYLEDDSTPLVDLILLDINMPRMSGFDFLHAAQHYLGEVRPVPVVMMLTTSLNPEDRRRADENRFVSGFMNKPLRAEQISDLRDIVKRSHHQDAQRL